VAIVALLIANRHYKLQSRDQQHYTLPTTAVELEPKEGEAVPKTNTDCAPELPLPQRSCLNCGKQIVSVSVTGENGESRIIDVTPNSAPQDGCLHR
jgi:hypothetical protein